MGRDKAELIHPDGRTLARRTIDLLQLAGCKRIAISLRHDQSIPNECEIFPGLEIVRDGVNASNGPLSGIVAAMKSDLESDWLVLACDLPKLEVDALRHLVESKRVDEMFLAYRSEVDGLPEPLCAIYSANSLKYLLTAIEEYRRCPRKILIENQCRLLQTIRPGSLFNANTSDEWTKVITA